MNEQEIRDFDERIMLGANRAFQRLVAEKKHNNGELAFSCGGEIVRVKACEFDKVL